MGGNAPLTADEVRSQSAVLFPAFEHLAHDDVGMGVLMINRDHSRDRQLRARRVVGKQSAVARHSAKREASGTE